MRILITGITGFVGSHMADYLIKNVSDVDFVKILVLIASILQQKNESLIIISCKKYTNFQILYKVCQVCKEKKYPIAMEFPSNKKCHTQKTN